MNLKMHGKNTSNVDVTNISMHGIWILYKNKEYFMPFEEFPWFRDATIAKIFNVEEVSPEHLYWPELDIDLTLDIIKEPENYPLKAK